MKVLLFLSWIIYTQCHFTYFDDETFFRMEWPGPIKDNQKLPFGEGVHIVTPHNEQYDCFLPNDVEKTAAMDLKDAFLPSPSEIELLKPLFDKDVCVLKVGSYWTYELCHGKGLKQFHKEESFVRVSGSDIVTESSVNSFTLGNYKEPNWRNSKEIKEIYGVKTSKPPKYRFTHIELPYYAVDLEGGEICDLTGQPRQVQVLYFCQSDVKYEFFDIVEVSTCKYEALIFTSYLCENKKYRPKEAASAFTIKCLPKDVNTPKKPRDWSKFKPTPPRYRDIFGKSRENPDPSKGGDEDEDDDFIENFWVMDALSIGHAPDLDSEDPFSHFGRKVEIEKFKDSALKNGKQFLVKPPPPPPSQKRPVIADYSAVKDFLRGEYCLHGGMPGGWWKYELCFGHRALQYHDEINNERKAVRTEVLLGHFRVDAHLKWLEQNPNKRPKAVESRRTINLFYGEGDVCVETGKKRQVIVKLMCNPKDRSESISISLTEPSICSYEITVLAGQWLCNVIQIADDDGLFDMETALEAVHPSEEKSKEDANSPHKPQGPPEVEAEDKRDDHTKNKLNVSPVSMERVDSMSAEIMPDEDKNGEEKTVTKHPNEGKTVHVRVTATPPPPVTQPSVAKTTIAPPVTPKETEEKMSSVEKETVVDDGHDNKKGVVDRQEL